jgi:hypothetical protein
MGPRTSDENIRSPRYQLAGKCRNLIMTADRRYAIKGKVSPLDPAKLP